MVQTHHYYLITNDSYQHCSTLKMEPAITLSQY